MLCTLSGALILRFTKEQTDVLISDTIDIQIALCIANTKGLTFLHSSDDHPILATISWFLNTKALWVSRIWWMTCNY